MTKASLGTFLSSLLVVLGSFLNWAQGHYDLELFWSLLLSFILAGHFSTVPHQLSTCYPENECCFILFLHEVAVISSFIEGNIHVPLTLSFLYKNIVFPPRLNILIFLLILAWKYPCIVLHL